MREISGVSHRMRAGVASPTAAGSFEVSEAGSSPPNLVPWESSALPFYPAGLTGGIAELRIEHSCETGAALVLPRFYKEEIVKIIAKGLCKKYLHTLEDFVNMTC